MRVLLDVQSHFSLARGTAAPEALLDRAAALGYTHIAIADEAGLYGLPEVLRHAPDYGIEPLIGASLRIAGAKLVFLVAEARGYAHLCMLLTRWHTRPRLERDDADRLRACLARPAEEADGAPIGAGLVALVDEEGWIEPLRAAGVEVYWRLGRSLRRPPPAVQAAALPVVATPEVCMLRPDEHELHRLLVAIGHKTTIDRVAEKDLAPATAWLHPPAAYAERFAVFPEALAEAEALAKALHYRHAPSIIMPPPPDRPDTPDTLDTAHPSETMAEGTDEDADAGTGAGIDGGEALLRARAYAGAERRYGELSESVLDRLEYELDLIDRKGFTGYFLLVERIVAASPRTCGRGSGAASLVNYCLGVTNVDPIKYNLMFERFLNEGRTDPPDIDVDFAWDERDAVLERAVAEQGPNRVARVCNHNRYKTRMAIRETARAFGFDDPAITRRLKAMPQHHGAYDLRPDLEAALADHDPVRDPARVPTAAADTAATREARDPWREALRLAARLVGRPRCLSLHCGGLVVTPGRIDRHAPVEIAAKGPAMIQWEKDGAEAMGLVKIDLLGNRSLAVIRDAIRDVAAAHRIPTGRVIPLDPADDPATRALMARGETMGVFYVESPAMRLLQARSRRGDFEHLVIHSSIIRPAANDFIREYLARLHGKPWAPLHPKLAGVFDETYGIPVYQEDVIKLAAVLAGFDYAAADRLRKCLGKHDAARRLKERFGDFRAGCRARGVDEATVERAWTMVMSMTGYSFCKPHSASYARVSFESAFLKAHYPAHFMAAVISNGGGYYSTQAYVSECMRMGLRVLGPDVNASRATFVEEAGGIRTGLAAVAGLREVARERILDARDRGGPFDALADCLDRSGLRPDDARLLARVGAFDALAPGLDRPQLLWLVDRGARARKGGGLLPAATPKPPPLPPYTWRQRCEAEYAALGFLPGAHPLLLHEEAIRAAARQRAVLPARRMAEWVGRRVTILGWPVTAKVVETKAGDPMVFHSFEDVDAIVETVFFPKVFARFRRHLGAARPFLITGVVEEEFGVACLTVERCEPLPAATDRGTPPAGPGREACLRPNPARWAQPS